MLYQANLRPPAGCRIEGEVVEGRKTTVSGDFEKRSMSESAAGWGCAIEIAVRSLHQSSLRVASIGTDKIVQQCEFAATCELEDDSDAVSASDVGSPIQIPISTLDYRANGLRAVSVVKTMD